jgi:hypothetical protein
MHRISIAERRARLAVRHALAPTARAKTPLEVAERLVALHGTDPATVHLAVLARTGGVDVVDIEDALYTERSLVRLLGMRRSMFVVPLDLAPVVQAACTRAISVRQRKSLVKDLDRAEFDAGGDVGAWLADVEEAVVAALRRRGEATARELVEDEPRLATQLVMAEAKPYETTQNITSRVLFQLGCDARIVRGRPQGTWTSSRWVWAPVESWLPGGLPELDTTVARTELLRRWLAAFGPAPLTDLTWWTGLGLRDVKLALAPLDTAEVEIEGTGPGLVLAEDLDPVDPVEPWAALLPALDPTAMGWKGRDWYLGDHAGQVVDRTGNIGATVWWDGRIVGGWAQRPSGEIVHRLLDDVGADARAAVEAAAEALARQIGPVRVSPRFAAPLDRELRA